MLGKDPVHTRNVLSRSIPRFASRKILVNWNCLLQKASIIHNTLLSFLLPGNYEDILSNMASDSGLYIRETPTDVSGAKGLHLLTESTPNGQATQILLEELADAYGISWSTTLMDISTNEQKKEWYLRLNPNGRIPTIVDNSQDPPFPVIETSAQLLYLVQAADRENKFSFTNHLEQSTAIQWLFFWHGGGAPYQGQANLFRKLPEKIPCKYFSKSPDFFELFC